MLKRPGRETVYITSLFTLLEHCDELRGSHDAIRQRPRLMVGQFEQRAVPGSEISRATGQRQLEKFLVIGVVAFRQEVYFSPPTSAFRLSRNTPVLREKFR